MAKLTDRQMKFVDEYLIDLNATQAAIRAGYSEKNASRIAIELLNKTHVSDCLNKRMKKREERTEITQDMVLKELAKIGFANITDYLEYRTLLREVEKDKDGKQQYDWAMSVIAKDSAEVDGAPIQEVSIAKDGTFKFKLYSKLDALEKIGRHLGMFEKPETEKGNPNASLENMINLIDLIRNPTPNREIPDDE